MPTNIRKALVAEFGGVEKINIVDAEISEPPAKHVQVEVMYSGFSGADINMRQGVYPLQQKAPLTPGYCLVGTVRLNGRGSTKFQPGAVVGCLTVYGAQAELVNLPEKHLLPVPAGIDLQAATALILDWNTAYGMVERAARVAAGQTVFVHGMSGAVGHAVAALALLRGALVYGTASEPKHAALRQLGATPFTYADKDWMSKMQDLGGADAVFDPLGFESWDESYAILRPGGSGVPGGILVGYGGNLRSLEKGAGPGHGPKTEAAPTQSSSSSSSLSVLYPTLKLLARNYLAFWSAKRTTFYWIARDQATFRPDLDALFALLADGTIAVPIKQVFALEDIQDAHRSWGRGEGVGSVLIRVGDGNKKWEETGHA